MFSPSFLGDVVADAAETLLGNPQPSAVAARTEALSGTAARHEAAEARNAVDIVRWDTERLLMITEALWTFVKREHGYTDADLIRMVAEIDARDGRIDGRVAPTPPGPCPHCHRMLARRRPTCLYCGKPVIASPFER